MNKLLTVTEEKQDIAQFNTGDTLKVHCAIKETEKNEEKERIQIFQGVCIKKKNAGIASTFTVRKISDGIGVERIFPVYGPNVRKVEVVFSGKVRRAKLYFLKALTGRKAKLKAKDKAPAKAE